MVYDIFTRGGLFYTRDISQSHFQPLPGMEASMFVLYSVHTHMYILVHSFLEESGPIHQADANAQKIITYPPFHSTNNGCMGRRTTIGKRKLVSAQK